MIIYLPCHVVNDYSQLLAELVDEYSPFSLLFRIMIVSEMIRILGYKRESGDRVVTGKVYQRHTFCLRDEISEISYQITACVIVMSAPALKKRSTHSCFPAPSGKMNPPKHRRSGYGTIYFRRKKWSLV